MWALPHSEWEQLMERLACRFGSQVDVIEERDGYVLISLSCRVLRTVLRNFFLTPENDMSVFPSTVPHFEGMRYAHICRLT